MSLCWILISPQCISYVNVSVVLEYHITISNAHYGYMNTMYACMARRTLKIKC